MQSIKDTVFEQLGRRRNSMKISYAIIYILCAVVLCLATLFIHRQVEFKVMLYLLAALLLGVGLYLCYMKADVAYYRPTGSLITRGKLRISDDAAAALSRFISGDDSLPDSFDNLVDTNSSSRLLYVMSYDRKFLAIQIHKIDSHCILQPVTRIMVATNEQSAIISSRLHLKVDD